MIGIVVTHGLAAVAGAVFMYFFAKHNGKLLAGWYADAVAAGKIAQTISSKV